MQNFKKLNKENQFFQYFDNLIDSTLFQTGNAILKSKPESTEVQKSEHKSKEWPLLQEEIIKIYKENKCVMALLFNGKNCKDITNSHLISKNSIKNSFSEKNPIVIETTYSENNTKLNILGTKEISPKHFTYKIFCNDCDSLFHLNEIGKDNKSCYLTIGDYIGKSSIDNVKNTNLDNPHMLALKDERLSVDYSNFKKHFFLSVFLRNCYALKRAHMLHALLESIKTNEKVMAEYEKNLEMFLESSDFIISSEKIKKAYTINKKILSELSFYDQFLRHTSSVAYWRNLTINSLKDIAGYEQGFDTSALLRKELFIYGIQEKQYIFELRYKKLKKEECPLFLGHLPETEKKEEFWAWVETPSFDQDNRYWCIAYIKTVFTQKPPESWVQLKEKTKNHVPRNKKTIEYKYFSFDNSQKLSTNSYMVNSNTQILAYTREIAEKLVTGHERRHHFLLNAVAAEMLEKFRGQFPAAFKVDLNSLINVSKEDEKQTKNAITACDNYLRWLIVSMLESTSIIPIVGMLENTDPRLQNISDDCEN